MAIVNPAASKLVFADVLGTNSGIDIELIVERASLHQNVVLRTKPSLPETFNEANARFYVYTEMNLDTLTAGDDVDVTNVLLQKFADNS